MPSIAENPIVLLIVAFLILCLVGTIRAVFPDKPRTWLFLLPLGLALVGVGLDFFIQTDQEKIRSVLKATMKALENEDIKGLGTFIASDYQDSVHNSKTHLLQHAENGLERSPLAKANISSISIPKIEGSETKAFITTYLTFTPESFIAQHYKPLVIVVAEFRLHKQSNGHWLISRIEITEVDKQSIKWQHVQGHF